MTIFAKLGASLTGFWWSLDDRERLLVIGFAGYVALTALSIAGAREREKDRARLADAVAARLAASARADRG